MSAQGPAGVEIHAFGGWAYGETDGNRFVLGSEEGSYENTELALNLAATPSDRVSVVAQVFFANRDRLGQAEEGVEIDLDYAFAEIFFSDLAKLRFGKAKHPFGLYGEIFDVGTLRPFFTLPQSIYGLQGFTAKSYLGAGATGASGGGARGWGLQYDVYGGQIEGVIEIPSVLTLTSDRQLDGQFRTDYAIEDLVGLRFNALTPIDGLLFGVSAYRGNEVIDRAGELGLIPVVDHDTYGAHLEYLGDRLWTRAEWAGNERPDLETEGFYLEVAYKLTAQWQLAGRFDSWDARVPSFPGFVGLPPFYEPILQHDDLALGVNYWFTSDVVLRLEVHQIEGNRFAFPDDAEEILRVLLLNDLDETTDVLIFGVQFSF